MSIFAFSHWDLLFYKMWGVIRRFLKNDIFSLKIIKYCSIYVGRKVNIKGMVVKSEKEISRTPHTSNQFVPGLTSVVMNLDGSANQEEEKTSEEAEEDANRGEHE